MTNSPSFDKQSNFLTRFITKLKLTHSLRRTMLLYLILLTVIPVFIVGLIARQASIDNSRRNLESKLDLVSTLQEQAIQRWLNQIIEALVQEARPNSVASMTIFNVKDIDRIEHTHLGFSRHFRSNSNYAEKFEDIFLLDKEGVIVSAVDMDAIGGQGLKNHGVFKEGLKNSYIHPLYYEINKNKAILYVSVPVFSSQPGNSENVVGVLVGKVNTEFLEQILTQTADLETYFVTYPQEEGITQPYVLDPRLQWRADAKLSPGIQAGLKGLNNTDIYPNYEGVSVVGTYLPLNKPNHLGVVLLAEQPEATAFAESRQTLNSLILVVLFVIIIDFVLSLIITNRITTPIRELTDVAIEISQGNRNRTIDINRDDEIGTLATTFNVMTTQLRDLINNLESRVKRRTQALQTSAEVAQKMTGILDLETLLEQVSSLIQSAFNYYCVQILLTDEQNYLVTQANSTENSTNNDTMPVNRFKLGSKNLIGQAGLGTVQIANDVSQNPNWQIDDSLPNTKAEIALPLRRGTNILGVLDVHSNQLNAFSEDDVTILKSIADQLAIAVRNARLFQESDEARQQAETLLANLEETSQDLSHRSAQLQTAIHVSKAASTILDTETLLQEAVNLLKKQFNFYYVGLFLNDEKRDRAVLRAGTGEAGRQQIENKHSLKIDDNSMIGWCINHKQARIAGEAAQDEVRYVNPYLPETQSEMALPLISRQNALGALSVQSTKKNAFSEQDIVVLQSVADQLATALENSQLFSQTQAIQARFQDLYHRAPAGYHTLDTTGIIKEINNTELIMLGYEGEREEIIGKRYITEFMTAESKDRFDAALKSLVEKGDRITNLELTYIQANGNHLIVTTTVSPEIDEQGRIKEIYASTQDITQQKSIEAARETLLEKTETLYKLSQQLLTVETRSKVYEVCLDAVQTVNPSRGIAVLLNNQTSEQMMLELVAVWNNPNQNWHSVPIGTTFAAGDLGLQEMVLSGETVISSNGTTDARFTDTLHQLLDYMQIKSLVGTPVWSMGKVIGFLLIANHNTVPFAEEDIRLFEGVARQMSVSIDKQTHLQEALQQATQLEAAARVSKNTTSETDLSVLLPKVVTLIKDTFGYYHTSILLVDDYKQFAVLQASTGAVGEQLLAENYKIPIDPQSLVGATILEGEAQISFDVKQNPTFLNNPLLPDTHSELVLPLIVQGEVIGILDIQSEILGDFRSGEEVVLQTIADQLANAIHVARLFEQQLTAVQEIQELHRRYLDQKWEAYLQTEDNIAKTTVAFVSDSDFDETDQTILTDWFSNVSIKSNASKIPTSYGVPANQDNNDDFLQSALVSPILVRDTAIGSLGLLDNPDRDWSEDDISIMQEVAAQAALAIENARLIEETQHWVLLLQTSAEISQVITAILDVNTLISKSINLIQSKYQFRTVHLYLVNPESLQYANMYKSNPSLEDEIIDPDRITLSMRTLTWQAIQRQQTLTVQKNNPTLIALMSPEVADAASALIIPLIVRKELIGVLEIYSDQTNAFNQDYVAVLEILISQVASSIGNARAYQEQQEIADKLREVDKLKTQFLANMSHELRTPLNSIIGFSRVILKGIDGPLTKLQKTDLTSIHQSGQHLLGLINNILDLAKIEAGKLELNFEVINLQTLINGIVATAIGLAKDQSIKIVENVPTGLPTIEGDETRIRQILLNLVSNAAKFTEEGTITISALHDKDNDQVQISVADTGIGIAAKDLDAIFEEFTQVDASTTRRAGGTGLGLPITKRFIELHNGSITVESELNVGSTFTITLPVYQPKSGLSSSYGTSETGEELEENIERTLLVIDSDARVADYYEQYLEGKNIKVIPLTKGKKAVRKAKALQPYAIMLDILLPDIDGWQILTELKENERTSHIPVVICSIVEDRNKASQLNASNYLVKPVIKNDLLQTLKKLEKQTKSNKRVLVIDDQADDILLIKRILEVYEYKIVEATNGLDGLDIVYTNPPDLVVLDLNMPGLDGFGVLESLKHNSSTGNIPVIVITAEDLNNKQKSTIDQQADAFLRKGRFTDTDLVKCVGQFLN